MTSGWITTNWLSVDAKEIKDWGIYFAPGTIKAIKDILKYFLQEFLNQYFSIS